MAVTTIPTAGIADGAVDTTQLADDAVTAAKAGFNPGKIGQVVIATVGSTVSTSSGVYADVTGFTASITPSATSSKVLVQSYVFSDISAGAGTAGTGFIKLLRDSTTLETEQFFRYRVGNGNPDQMKAGLYHNYMDSPSSTSQLTYKYQFMHEDSGSFSIIGGAKITLMEILA